MGMDSWTSLQRSCRGCRSEWASAADRSPVSIYPTGGFPNFRGCGDLDSNGVVDLVTANTLTARIGVLRGKGDGTFGLPSDLPTPEGPIAVELERRDDDSFQDAIVLASRKGSRSSDGSDHGFGPARTYGIGDRCVIHGDGRFHQDGAVDVGAGCRAGMSVSSWRRPRLIRQDQHLRVLTLGAWHGRLVNGDGLRHHHCSLAGDDHLVGAWRRVSPRSQ